jgi:hypothetical protein
MVVRILNGLYLGSSIKALVEAVSKVEAMEGNLIDAIPQDQIGQMNTAADVVDKAKKEAVVAAEEEEDDDLPF